MLKQMLTTHFALTFIGLLSSVKGEEGFLANAFGYDSFPFLVSTFKEKCSDQLDSASCRYWNDLRHKAEDDLESSNIFSTKKTKQLTLESKTFGKEIPEENSAEEISNEIPMADPENHFQKRFTVFRKNPIARGYKRGPGFRSWGGKRDSTLIDKKSKFGSWGGKRDGEFLPDYLTSEERDAPDKRMKFQNWGGKKNTDDFLGEIGNRENLITDDQKEKKGSIWKNMGFYLSEPFKKHVPKRPQFQSWGGKRALDPWPEFLRFFDQKSKLLINGGEKRKFSSWGGKRYDENANQHENFHSGGNSKRQVFQNWGGKREAPDTDLIQDMGGAPALKEPALEGKAKQVKREAWTNWNNDEPPSDFNYWGGELKDRKDGR